VPAVTLRNILLPLALHRTPSTPFIQNLIDLENNKNNQIRTCLLVDDDDDDKEIFCLALKNTNATIECTTASDGLEALSILSNKSFIPDYIFLDLNMPRMNGKECLKEIRKHNHLNHVPVIIFTTSAAGKDIEETKRLGANSFITKPPLVSQLATKLAELFNNGSR
jgi:CheY-like chemotaxis protein